MKRIKCEFHGITPIILHSCQGVNPLHPLAIELKKLTGKRNKTEEDLIAISDIEWELGLYFADEIGVYIPAENIEATIREGAKARKKGKDIVKGFRVLDMQVPLDFGEDLTKDQLMHDYRFRDVRAMKVQQSRVMRTRPRFNMWNIVFEASYDENVLTFDEVVTAIEYSGQYVGLCDSRPKYGQFTATITELD